MIKKILSLLIVGFVVVGCGINCKDKPPRRAVQENSNNTGMRYHYSLYEPVGDAGHTPSFKCTNYEYGKSHLYFDDFAEVKGSDVIWIAIQGNTSFNMVPDNIMNKAIFSLSKSNIKIYGLSQGYEYLNGTYRVETTSPDSWGVPIN